MSKIKRKPGRPRTRKPEEIRHERIIMLSDEESRKLSDLARQRKTNRSSVVRQLIGEAEG